MLPMDFEEFTWAVKGNDDFALLGEFWRQKKPLAGLHRQLMRDFRLYMLVGGMPQAVVSYLESNNFMVVDMVKREILELYAEDFHRIDSTGRASQLFQAIPAQLSSNASRYQIATSTPESRRSRMAELIANMEDSRTVMLSYHANNPNIGMALTKNLDYYKMFVLDTGLFITLVYMDRDFTDNDIYHKFLSDKQHTDLGYVYKNMVAQMTVAKRDALFYYTFPYETSNHKYEVDFIITRGNKICPIEVKSSNYKTHKSLDAFYQKCSSRIGQRYLVYTKDFCKEQDIFCLPIYMYPFI